MLKLINDNLAIEGGNPIKQPTNFKWPMFDALEIDTLIKFTNTGEWWSPLVGSTTNSLNHSSPIIKLQNNFSSIHDCEFGVACSSGTTAIMLALKAIGIGPGDSVIVPDYTWMATPQAAIMLGAKVLFCDIIPETLNIDPEKVKKLLNPDVKAIIPVHMLGLPAEIDELKSFGIPIIEDACLANCATYKNMSVGSLGEAAAFSFNAYKLIAAGEGGIVTTNDYEIAKRAEEFANNGQSIDDPWWQSSSAGLNIRMNQFGACIVNAQLTRMKKFHGIRTKQADALRKALIDIPGITIQPKYSDKNSSYYGLPLSYDLKIYRANTERMEEVIKAEGIEITANYGGPLTKQPSFSEKWRPINLNAIAATKNTLYFPHWSLLYDQDTEAVVKCFEKVYTKRMCL